MSDFPAELDDFPHHLIEKLRAGTLSSPRERMELKDKGSGWLYRLSSLASEARDDWKSASLVVEAVRARSYAHNRSTGSSVSGAKLDAETTDDYLKAKDKARIAEKRYRDFEGFYKATEEAVNSMKISIKYDAAEHKYIGKDGQA